MKKLINITVGIAFAAAVAVAAPSSVKAQGMPCTEDTLKQFTAAKAVADAELAQMQALKAAADANVAALKAQGVTGLEMLQATDAATNAANVVTMYQHKVNSAQAAIDNITGRGAVEQYYLDMEAKWQGRAQLDAVKTELDGALQITSAAQTHLNDLRTALAGQMELAAFNPAMQANVNEMQTLVAAAEADYNAKKAASDALAVKYQQQMGTLNWATDAENAQYTKFVQDYGTNMAKDYTVINKDGNEEALFTYYAIDGPWYLLDKPDEYAIRWFE